MLRMEPEIVLGPDEKEREVEAPPLTVLKGGVTDRPQKERQEKKGAAKRAAKGRRGWKFWQRPRRRSRELEELRQGWDRLAGVMGSIRDELVVAKSDRAQLNRTLSPLPVAVKGLQQVGETQARTNKALGGVKQCLERAEEKDAVFFKTMDRVGNTMSHMDMAVVGMGRTFSSVERTSKQSVRTMERLGERIDASDRFLEEAFARLRDTEQEFAQHMVGSSKRSAFVTVTLCLLLTAGIAFLAHTLGGASPHVTVVRSAPAGVIEEAGNGRMPPLDWQALPPERSGLAEAGWPLDLSTVADDWTPEEPGTEGRLLFVNKLPE
jgi:hypothetical protein